MAINDTTGFFGWRFHYTIIHLTKNQARDARIPVESGQSQRGGGKRVDLRVKGSI
jgi:hypothetical protein